MTLSMTAFSRMILSITTLSNTNLSPSIDVKLNVVMLSVSARNVVAPQAVLEKE